jgi:hypothetical protein
MKERELGYSEFRVAVGSKCGIENGTVLSQEIKKNSIPNLSDTGVVHQDERV